MTRAVRQRVAMLVSLLLTLTYSASMTAQNAVGSVNGSLTVNDMGAAVYSMTFDAPNGGRMTPKIGLAYNSQSAGYGLAGYGIDVTGISVITSGGRDMFHNGKVRGANYDKDSNFYLDGKRLVLQEGKDGEDGAEYSPEGDPHTKVTLHGDINSGMAYFEVTAADGTVFTYGSSNNSRLQVSKDGAPRTAAWYISKAVNRYGENISYTYNNENLCVSPQTITYGTERGLTAKVEFSYIGMASGNVRTFRIGSQQGMRNKLLSSVKTIINGQTHRKYDFTYDETSSDKCSRLTTVTESNGADESLNPTVLEWNTEKITSEPIHSVSDYETINPYFRVDKEFGKSTYFSVDMDGNGITDGIRVCQGTVGSALYTLVFISRGYVDEDGNTKFSNPIRYTLPANINFGSIDCVIGALSVMDHDGDGLNDLAFPYFVGGTMVRLCVIYGSSVRSSSDYYGWLDVSLAKADEMPLFANMDMNGDGRDDVLVFEKSDTNGAYAVTSIQYDEAYGPDSGGVPSGRLENCHRTMLKPLAQPEKIFTGDYNNDGLVDMLVVCENGYTIYYNNGYTDDSGMENVFSDANKHEGTSVKSYWRMEQGDFDGDGLVDLFCYDKDTQQFHIAYYNGDGTFRNEISPDNWGIYDQTETDKDDNKFSVIVTDFDNDGKSDVVLVKAFYHFQILKGMVYDHTDIRWLHSTDNTLEKQNEYDFSGEEESYESYFFGGDFNGDGRLEIANYGRQLDTDNAEKTDNAIHIYYFGTKDASRSRLLSVYDGFGNKTSIDYRYYAKRFVTNGSSQYPLNSYTLPLPVVSTVKSDGFSMEYMFDDLKIHIAGGGVMGFSCVEKSDMLNYVSETSQVTSWNTKKWKPSEVKKTNYNLFAHKTATTTETYKFVDDIKGNSVSYMSERVAIGYDNDTITTKSIFDKALMMVTETQNYYGKGNKMYKSTSGSNYVACGTSWIPTVVTAKQVHSDNSSSTYKNVTKYAYDAFGNPLITVSFAGTACADTVRYTYDQWGNVTSETFQGNDETTGRKYYEYDPTGCFLIKTYTIPESSTISYTYDVFGNLLSETDETNPEHSLVTTHEYDNWGARTRSVYLDGTETIYYTDWEEDEGIGNWFVEERRTASPITRKTYDSNGREIGDDYYGTEGGDIRKTNIYNDKGQVSQIVTTHGRRTTTETFEYDARGRVVSDQHSSGAGCTYEYGKNTVSVTDAAGRVVTKTYDHWGNVKTITDPAQTIEYRYRSNGKPGWIFTADGTTTVTYDAAGQRTKLIDLDAGTTTTTYGKNGQIKTETDGRGVKTTYTYDALGRVTQRKRENPSDKYSEASITTYTYGTTGNAKGRVVKKDCDGKTVEYEYDEFGRVVSEARPNAWCHDGTADVMRKTYTYDNKGQLATVTFPASHSSKGLIIGYRYDSYGNRTHVLYDNKYNNRLVWNYGNNGLEKQTRSDYLGNIKTNYDNNGNIISKTFDYSYANKYKETRGIRDTLLFEWDALTNNLLSKTVKGAKEQYAYDTLDRLTEVSRVGGSVVTTSYADNGNIISKSGIGEYLYDTSNKPHAVREVENIDGVIDNREVYTQYDLNGKVAAIGDKDYTAFSWYEYGPDDEKWSSWGWSPEDTNMEWDVEHTYWGNYERLVKDYRIREYYFLDNDVFLIRTNPYYDIDEPDIWDVNYYQMERDNIGNIVAIYDLHHRKVFEAEYDAWGKQTVIKDEICFNKGFTGHEMLPHLGLVHMDGRVYDPALGRFLSPDNYVQLPENSQSFNRYSYCFNNPLKFTDPDGNWAVWDDIVAMLTGGTINLLCNIENLVSPIHAACSFAVGAAAGEATLYGGPMAGAAVSGVGNSCVNQLFQNGNINGAQVLTDGMISMGCSYLGGMMGDKLSKPINSLFGRISNNILRDVVSNATCNSIVGFGLGGAASFLDSETSFWDGALHGAGIGFISGAITGVAQGISENRQTKASKRSVQENLRGYDEIPPQNQISPYEKGQAGVNRAIAEFEAQGGTLLNKEVTIGVDATRTRVDFVGRDRSGILQLFEVKNGPNAGPTTNQKIVMPKLEIGTRFIPYGKNAIGAGFTPKVPYTGRYNFNYIHYR